MPRLIKTKTTDFVKKFIGKQYVCPVDGNTYEVDESDVNDIKERAVGHPRDEETLMTFPCGCGGRIGFDTDYRGEIGHRHFAS